jgi:hypothetical protein
MIDEYGALGRVIIGRGNGNTHRVPAQHKPDMT